MQEKLHVKRPALDNHKNVILNAATYSKITHLLFLHQMGFNNPLGLIRDTDKVSFHPYFFTKDTLGFVLLGVSLVCITLENILELGWSVLTQNYSLDLAPSGYTTFSVPYKTFWMNNSEEQVSQAVENFFQSKPTKFYKEGIYMLPERWEKVIHNSGKHIN